MDLNEIKYHIELYTQRLGAAHNDEDRLMLTNMLNVWKGMADKVVSDSLHRREQKLQKKIEAKGFTYTDWLAWAASLYPIAQDADNSFTVTSIAIDWKTNQHKHMYTYDSKIEALEKIDKLITTKEYDRARGHASGKNDLK
jgi:hypothetical protein